MRSITNFSRQRLGIADFFKRRCPRIRWAVRSSDYKGNKKLPDSFIKSIVIFVKLHLKVLCPLIGLRVLKGLVERIVYEIATTE